ncbi:hypothetical protein [Nocardia huaxiensis]|uniref:DUF8020 domain-containing protein n=1 Tax=Nocardia huaxiensis TaxID=2755382 RepID=A0A7D6VET9_9NOCA|nr:hypothetical protein [Nocardia huaxiensis]QLY33731.1 hypothetical protein H0264_17165 [Nocardia huaxiensis]UFS99345.1 hypothetical protein LPY97_16355 [Nocardia huaxiensis]
MFTISPKTRLACLGIAAFTATVLVNTGPDASAAPLFGPELTAAQNNSPGIPFTAQIRDGSVILRTAAGSLTVRDGMLQVLDDHGTIVSAVALRYGLDDKIFPIAARIDGDTAILTPGTEAATALPAAASDADPGAAVPAAAQIADPATENFDSAVQAAVNELTLGTMIGSLIGSIIGAGIGCVAGAVVGAALMPPIFLPGAAGGCLAGIVAGAGLGVIAGTIAVGGPVALAAAVKFFTTMANPPAPEAVPAAPTDLTAVA